jgi:hypothetical protein
LDNPLLYERGSDTDGMKELYSGLNGFEFINSPVGYGEDGNCIQIYDSYYGGFYVSKENRKAIVTRFKKNTTLTMDDVKSKNIIVDPADDEAVRAQLPEETVITVPGR